MAEMKLGNVMIDCRDGEKLRDFYAELTGWKKVTAFDTPGILSSNGIRFMFMSEEDFVPCVWPEEPGKQQKQMHFDFQVDSVLEAVEKALKLGAVLQSEEGMLRVFPAGGEFRRGENLRLTLLHPYSKDEDQVLTLVPDKLGWHAEHAPDPGHDWNLQLGDEAGSWRLRGRLPRGQHAAHLGPALEAK